MPVVPINSSYSNIPDFIDSLFDPDVRSASAVQAAIAAGDLTVAFSDQGGKILPVWLAAWQAAQGAPYNANDLAHCPASDNQLMQFLAAYFRANGQSMYVPTLKLQSAPSGQPPVYELSGYEEVPLRPDGQWDFDAVNRFLELAYYGAHFVVVHALYDLPYYPQVAPLWQLFKDSSALAPYLRHDPGNSHYTNVLNICGEYVPDITGDSAPSSCPFLVAFLVCPTVSDISCNPTIYNTFVQLEGWESDYSRHNADYALYKQTLWNISTFGGCAYSEKRGTAIFLAPPGWGPQPSLGTYMPPYYGAETPQNWLDTSLVTLPPGYWKIVVRSASQPLDGGSGPTSVTFAISPPAGAKALTWSVRNIQGAADIRFDLCADGAPVQTGIGDGAQTGLVSAGSSYYLANVTGSSNLSAYFEVVIGAE